MHIERWLSLTAVLLVAACNPSNPDVATLALASPKTRCAAGQSLRVQADATYTDGSSERVTLLSTWSSSNSEIASVEGAAGTPGLVSCRAEGRAQLRAELGGRSAQLDLEVGPKVVAAIDLELADEQPSPLPAGLSRTLRAVARFSDQSRREVSSEALWSSSDGQVLAVAHGEVTARAPGFARVSAALDGVTGSIQLQAGPAALLGLQLAGTATSLAKGTSLTLAATATYSDGTSGDVTRSVGWSSSDAAVLSVEPGRIVARQPGTAELSAELAGFTATRSFTVTAAEVVEISVGPASPDLPRGVSERVVATGRFTDGTEQDLTRDVRWSTSSAAILAFDAFDAQLVWAVDVGTARLSAAFAGHSGEVEWRVLPARLAQVHVQPDDGTVSRLTSRQFSLLGQYTDGSSRDLTASAVWSSSDPSVLGIDAAGLATGLQLGAAQVRAAYQGKTLSANVTVVAAPLTSIAIAPASAALAKGRRLAFTATGHYADGTTADLTARVAWASSDPAVALVSSAGVASTFSTGNATVQASLGETQATAQLAVGPAVLDELQVTPPAPMLAKGTRAQLAATAVFSDATTQDVTTAAGWSSTAVEVAEVSGAPGQVLALEQGSTGVTATWSGRSAIASVTVTPARLVAIGLTPTNASLPLGTERAYSAVGVFTDGTSQDLSSQATWSTTSGAAVASNAPGKQGLVSARAVGSTAVRAAYAGIVGSTQLTVTPAALVSLAVDPGSLSLPAGVSAQLTVTGTYTDGTLQDLTASASFVSSAPASVSVAGGRVRAEAQPGVAQITASFDGKSVAAQVTATPARLDAIALAPLNASMAQGTTRQLVAWGTYSDGTTAEITSTAAWSSSNTAVVMVSNAQGSQGLASAVSEGVVTVTAAKDGISRSTSLTVLGGTITAIEVVPANPSAAKGTLRQLYAQATLSDGSTQDVTTQATWTSSDETVATVSNASGSHGLATAVSMGTTTITATLSGTSGATTLAVTAPTLRSLAVTPQLPSVDSGASLALRAFGTYSDGTTTEVTGQVLWESSNDLIATVSNAQGSAGVVTGGSAGQATISASLSGRAAATTVTVSVR